MFLYFILALISSFFIRDGQKRQDETGKQFPVISSSFGLIILFPYYYFLFWIATII